MNASFSRLQSSCASAGRPSYQLRARSLNRRGKALTSSAPVQFFNFEYLVRRSNQNCPLSLVPAHGGGNSEWSTTGVVVMTGVVDRDVDWVGFDVDFDGARFVDVDVEGVGASRSMESGSGSVRSDGWEVEADGWEVEGFLVL